MTQQLFNLHGVPWAAPGGFEGWRTSVVSAGALPIISVLGSRGKTTVVRLLDAIYSAAGLDIATKTDAAVEIRGRRQRGELAPWSRSLDELTRGSLDIGIEEIDWVTTHAIGVQPQSSPVVVVTNLCGNREACLIQGDSRRAIASLPSVFEAVLRSGFIVLNGDDLDVSSEDLHHDRLSVYVSTSAESPAMSAHLQEGGLAAWSEAGTLTFGTRDQRVKLCATEEIAMTLQGRAGFQVHNALTAATVGLMTGVPAEIVAEGLVSFAPNSERIPSSIRVVDVDGITVVIDRPNPSWFLRAVLRTVRDVRPHRVIAVAGQLLGVPTADLPEVGRLLGRSSNMFVLHSEDDIAQRSAALRQGAAQTEFPPVIVHTKTEQRALVRAIAMAKKGDLLLFISDHPHQAHRALQRLLSVRPRMLAEPI